MKKKWYYTQKTPESSYSIYNPNSVNKYVADVCGKEDADDICNSVNKYDELKDACESIKHLLYLLEGKISETKLHMFLQAIEY